MLEAAQERKREGLDVVAAIVETHGRKETEALLDGLEALPRRTIDYRGHRFQEMDLDAVLARRPQIVLVDELAHTNVPGSRHVKRWQDADEIMASGINVYSTLNIQHLESLNDIVERIAGVKVRETLPDSVLHRADDIELVDLSPGGSAEAASGGKGLRARAGAPGNAQLLLARQPDGSARTGSAASGGAGRRSDAGLHAGPCG